MVQHFLDLLAVVIQGLEIAHDLNDLIHNGKASGIPVEDPGKTCHLGLVDYADENAFFLTKVHAPGGNEGHAVVQLPDNIIGQLLGIVRNDLKTNGTLSAAEQMICHSGGGKGIENAENHRLHLIVIDKIAGQGNQGIDAKIQAEKTLFRMLLMDNGRHEIRAAAVGAGSCKNRLAEAHVDAGN